MKSGNMCQVCCHRASEMEVRGLNLCHVCVPVVLSSAVGRVMQVPEKNQEGVRQSVRWVVPRGRHDLNGSEMCGVL